MTSLSETRSPSVQGTLAIYERHRDDGQQLMPLTLLSLGPPSSVQRDPILPLPRGRMQVCKRRGTLDADLHSFRRDDREQAPDAKVSGQVGKIGSSRAYLKNRTNVEIQYER
jgi:hypothetical protein